MGLEGSIHQVIKNQMSKRRKPRIRWKFWHLSGGTKNNT